MITTTDLCPQGEEGWYASQNKVNRSHQIRFHSAHGAGGRGAREEPGTQRVLRRGPPSHQLVGGCLDIRQPHHRSGRWSPKPLSLWSTTPACASPARDRGRAIQECGGIYEDESCGNGGLGVGPSQHRRPDFLQKI